MNSAAPPLQDYQPTMTRSRPAAPRPWRPGQLFAAGFYGGLGFWCAGLVFYLVGLIVGVMVVVAAGGLGAIIGAAAG